MQPNQNSISSEQKWIPDGFHFLGPEESKNRRILLQKFAEVFERFGYSEITLPSFDYTSSFESFLEPGEDGLLKAKDWDGNELSPGVDLTLQVVKGMAARSHWEENQRVYYIAKKIRDHKKRNASRREILQIGAESLGTSTNSEIINHIQILKTLWSESTNSVPVSFVFGHSELFSKIVKLLNWDEFHSKSLKQFLYTKNLPELLSLAARLGVNERDTKILRLFLSPSDFFKFESFQKELSQLLDKKHRNEIDPLLETVGEFSNELKKLDQNLHCIWDPSLVRDVSYYTGILFQGFQKNNPEPVFAGGVYDQLYESFSGISKQASGFALHLDPIEELVLNKK